MKYQGLLILVALQYMLNDSATWLIKIEMLNTLNKLLGTMKKTNNFCASSFIIAPLERLNYNKNIIEKT